MPYTPPPDLAGLSLFEIAELAAAHKLPPIESWDPPHSGDSHMRIAADGRWYHRGSPITRPAMVRLFASILRREADNGYVLVTPFERQAIIVEDAPLLAVEVKSEGKGQARDLAFRLNTDELIIAGSDHPIIIRGTQDHPRPYLLARKGIEARIERQLFVELAELAVAEAEASAPKTDEAHLGRLGLWSGGTFFALHEAGER